MCSLTGSLMLISPASGFRNRIFRGFALDRRFQRLAVQQAVDDADILLHVGQLHAAKTHRAAGREPGADAEIDASRRHGVERGEGVGSHGGDTVGGDEHAGPQMDPAGLHRGGTHGDEAIRRDHLRVIEPGMGEPEFLGALRELPGLAGRGDADAEFHGRSP